MNAFPMWARKSRVQDVVRPGAVVWAGVAAAMWWRTGMPLPAVWVVWLLTGCLAATVLVPVLAIVTRHVTAARSAMVTGTAAAAAIAASWQVSTVVVIGAAIVVGVCLFWVVDAIRTGRRDHRVRAAVVDAVNRLAGE